MRIRNIVFLEGMRLFISYSADPPVMVGSSGAARQRSCSLSFTHGPGDKASLMWGAKLRVPRRAVPSV